LNDSAPQPENIPWWGKNILRGVGQKYTKYNKINNNSENFKGTRLLPGEPCPLPPPPAFRCGPAMIATASSFIHCELAFCALLACSTVV